MNAHRTSCPFERGKLSVSFFLAVESGGTKTDYLLADETRELARVRTGTIKRMRTDAETAAISAHCRTGIVMKYHGAGPRQYTTSPPNSSSIRSG